jgi:chromate transporter
MSKFWQWILINLKIGGLTFGGGSSRILMFQEELVDRHKWMSNEQFAQGMTVSQVVPGPNLVCLAGYLGAELFGLRGLVFGCIALILPGALFLAAFASLIPFESIYIQKILVGIAFASILAFSVFIFNLAKGLQVGLAGHRLKLWARTILAGSIAGSGLGGVAVHDLIVAGILLGFTIEFAL